MSNVNLMLCMILMRSWTMCLYVCCIYVTFCFQEGATRYEIKRSRFVIIF